MAAERCLTAGNRKLLAFVVYVLAVAVLALWRVRSAVVYDALTFGLVAFVGGNGLEHWSRRAGVPRTVVNNQGPAS